MLYRLLDEARDRAERGLTQTLGSGGAGGTFQARVERDFTAAEQSRRLAQLNAVEHGLCFGRTDSEPTPDRAGTLYIGRIGLRDDEYEPRLIDWRAPAAHPFYAATPRDPNGLIRRRHIYTRNRTVTGVDDEVFDLDRLSEPDRRSLSGEAMLIASITSRRTGRMSDVVATIQAEQDRVIRSALQGVLVVQGGPGTGKTVAALHRAARHLPPLQQPGPAVPRRDRRGAQLDRRALPRGQGRARRQSGSRRDQGRRHDGERAPPCGAQPAAGAAGRPGGHRGRRGHDGARPGRPAGPRPGPQAAQAAQRGPQAVHHR